MSNSWWRRWPRMAYWALRDLWVGTPGRDGWSPVRAWRKGWLRARLMTDAWCHGYLSFRRWRRGWVQSGRQ